MANNEIVEKLKESSRGDMLRIVIDCEYGVVKMYNTLSGDHYNHVATDVFKPGNFRGYNNLGMQYKNILNKKRMNYEEKPRYMGKTNRLQIVLEIS